MKKMERLRAALMIAGLLGIILFNASAELSRIHKGVASPIDETAASVYQNQGASEPLLRVQSFNGERNIPTNESVHVYLNHSFIDERVVWYPHRTIILTAILLLAYAITFFIERPDGQTDIKMAGALRDEA